MQSLPLDRGKNLRLPGEHAVTLPKVGASQDDSCFPQILPPLPFVACKLLTRSSLKTAAKPSPAPEEVANMLNGWS